MSLARWFYRGGRPNRAARIMNRIGAAVHALGVASNYLVTLEVRGRVSGRIISFPLVMAVVGGERYLVSMLGEEVNWVRNVRAPGARPSCVTAAARRCAWKRSRRTSARRC